MKTNLKYVKEFNEFDPYNEEKWDEKEHSNIPVCCYGVKCMVDGCQNLSSHKVIEENLWDDEEEKDKKEAFDMGHPRSTYLCDEHFNFIMDRDVRYFNKDPRFPNFNPLI